MISRSMGLSTMSQLEDSTRALCTSTRAELQAVLKCLGLTGKITNHSERELTWVMELTWAVNQMSSLNPWSQNEFSSNRDN
jgi:hypothetical protein